MGRPHSKVENANANVLNEVVIDNNNQDLFEIKIYILLVAIITVLNLAFKIYAMHNKKLKKKYISRANELDKI